MTSYSKTGSIIKQIDRRLTPVSHGTQAIPLCCGLRLGVSEARWQRRAQPSLWASSWESHSSLHPPSAARAVLRDCLRLVACPLCSSLPLENHGVGRQPPGSCGPTLSSFQFSPEKAFLPASLTSLSLSLGKECGQQPGNVSGTPTLLGRPPLGLCRSDGLGGWFPCGRRRHLGARAWSLVGLYQMSQSCGVFFPVIFCFAL